MNAVDRGLALVGAGRSDEAIRILGREARNNRLDADAQHAYGLALHHAWRFPEAIEQFLRTDRLKPDRWEVHQNLSAAYHGLEDYEAAYATASRCLALKPDNAFAQSHLADLHLMWGEMEEARTLYEQALMLTPDLPDAWVGLLFALDLIPGVTPEEALAYRQRFAAEHEVRAARYQRPHLQSRDPNRQVRIGYISGDFRDHTAAYMFGPLYEHHDRDRFLVFSYADLRYEDSVGAWFRTASNGWRGIRGCDPRTVADAIRADEIDILIDTAGYTNGGHLPVFAYKPAPIQVQAFGYLTGSGMPTMDAILVDDVLVPSEHESHFTERMLRVPYALGLGGINGDVPILPKPADAPLTFGHLGRSDKASRDAIRLWARVLKFHSGSRMLLKDRGFRMQRTEDRIRRWFAEEGIGPDRLDIRGSTDRGTHLATYNEVDVILDSIPQGGGTTTMEALWMGTPVLTMLGPRIISRIAATTLHALGKETWIAADEDDFVRRAWSLAAAGGSHLRDALTTSIVFDGTARTRQFEEALLGLWAEWCEKETPHAR